MRDPIVDDVAFEPIDALLEEVMRGAATAADASQSSHRRGRWLAAAALLLGTGVVGSVWWLGRPAGNRTAMPPPPEPQEPQPDSAAPRSLDELRKALQEVRSAQARARHITEWVPATDTVTMASDPAETVMLDVGAIAALRDDLLATVTGGSFLDDGQDSRRLRRMQLLEVTVGCGVRSFAFRVGFQGRRAAVLLADRFGPFDASAAFAEQLHQLYLDALRNGRRSRGEAENLEELRALPADSRSVMCPLLDAESTRTELPRFERLERLAFVCAGIGPSTAGTILDVLPPTLRELSIQGTSLTPADVRRLAELPLLAALTLEDGSPPDAIAALSAFGPRLQRLVVAWRSFDAGPVRVRVDEPREVAIHFPNDIAEPAATWRSLAGAVAGGLSSLAELSIEGDRGALDGAEVLAGATSLRGLRLSLRGPVRAVDIDWLPALASLRELSLRDSKVDDDAVPTLAKLEQLRTLDLTNTALTADGVAALHRLLPGCTITARPGVVVSAPQSVVLRKG